MSKPKIKVLIVDDQAIILDILRKGLSKDQRIEVVGTATDGFIALKEVGRLKPDVIVLDMEMPRMNGIQFLHKLMPENPIPTIVLSALTEKDSKITVEAFEAGAVDFQKKPSGGANALQKLFAQLWTKIKIAAGKDVSHYKHLKKDYQMPKKALDREARTDKIILGMGAMEVCSERGKKMKIFALGSCIGLSIYCLKKAVIGMAHVVLPKSQTDPEKAIEVPGYFADSAIDELLKIMTEMGCPKDKLVAKIAGGAKTRSDVGDYFGVGQRNIVAVKSKLIKEKIRLISEDTGGNISRTVTVYVGKTAYELHHPEKGIWNI